MADTNANKVYADLCAALDRRNWKYNRQDEKLTVTFGVSGDDIPMDFSFSVDEKRKLLRVFSRLPFNVPEDHRMDLALATCAVNYKLADGSFDYDLATGRIGFRLTASFRESSIGDGLFDYLIACSCSTVDDYNEKFLRVGNGTVSLEDFLQSL
jgi:hypothetical protein